jgi:2-oxoglutarate ferredoxin oxidoreductase subunit alpha
MPANTADVLARYDRILLPEKNLGQLAKVLRAEFGVDVTPYSRITGLPFRAAEIHDRLLALMEVAA